ncbi:hypothetical protein AK830_g1974 [Neonectria ditissima]|uniref:RRM domain-containing protein n=1 Tax=Neonectria ditissima TaxID=78410 RepID=A0A0P7BVT7_9HYPO|nr:hypothetical protein AK830_g1974 [Neonectria ditissima]
MSHYNAQWEDQIKEFRKNRRLLVARGISFSVTRATVEAYIRVKLTKPNSVIFFWPPSSALLRNPAHHMGWVMLGFDQPSDARTAEVDLQNCELNSRQFRVDRASRTAYAPRSSRLRETAPTTAAPTIAAPTAPAPAPATAAPVIIAPSVTVVVVVAAAAPAATPANPPVQPPQDYDASARNPSDSI